MEDDIPVGGIFLVVVGNPISGTRIHLDVSRSRRLPTYPHNRLPEVGSGLSIEETRMQNEQRLTADRP